MSKSHRKVPGAAWRGCAAALGLGLGANGLWMIARPAAWFVAVPGVAATGPYNGHFVAEVGAASIAAGLGALMAAARPAIGRTLMAPVAVFLGVHALGHLLNAASQEMTAALMAELGGVYLPATVALLLALPLELPRLPIPARLVEARIVATERRLGVKLDYMREVARASLPVLMRLGRFSALASERPASLPADIAHLATLAAARADDCGECVQIHVNLARADGIPPEVLRSVLADRLHELPAHLADAVRFAEAVAADDPAMDDFRERIERRIGEGGIAELGFAIAAARFYPTFKRVIGHARSCRVVKIELEAA
ncbi:MAG TPA: carboxymuconolactone decarboxylase family protein [Candidatus Cybelea sp.]|nr:carboxymuconolactone decarboxylase family protein [Candidatus Cybelea sp.]